MASASMTQESTHRPVILLVDDDEMVLESLSFALESDYEVRAFLSGSEALDSLPTFQPSAAILDIKMEGMDGFEVCKRLKDAIPELPVVFHSAYQDLKDPYEIMNELRPFGYVMKGAGLDFLKSTVGNAVRSFERITGQGGGLKSDLQHMRLEIARLKAQLGEE